MIIKLCGGFINLHMHIKLIFHLNHSMPLFHPQHMGLAHQIFLRTLAYQLLIGWGASKL